MAMELIIETEPVEIYSIEDFKDEAERDPDEPAADIPGSIADRRTTDSGVSIFDFSTFSYWFGR